MIKYIRGRKNDLGVTTDQVGPSLWPNGFRLIFTELRLII